MKLNNPNTDIKKQFESQIEKLKEEQRIIYVDRVTIIKNSLEQFIKNEFFPELEIDKVEIDYPRIRIDFINDHCDWFKIEYDNLWKWNDEGEYIKESFANPKIEWGKGKGGDFLDHCIQIGELSKIVKSKHNKFEVFVDYLVKFNNISKDPEYKSIDNKITSKQHELYNVENIVKKNQEQIIFNQGYIESFNTGSIKFKFQGDSTCQSRYRSGNWSSGDKFTFTKNPGKKTYTVTCFYKSVYFNDQDERIEETRNRIVKDNCREEYVWDSVRHYIYVKQAYEIKQQTEAIQN